MDNRLIKIETLRRKMEFLIEIDASKEDIYAISVHLDKLLLEYQKELLQVYLEKYKSGIDTQS